MNLLRFTAAWTGIGSALLYFLGLLFWERSWLAAQYPWARWVPIGITFVFSFMVSAVSFWRLTTHTLPPGGPDLFKLRYIPPFSFGTRPPYRFAEDWGFAFGIGMLLALFWRANSLVGMAGACLAMAGASQAFIPVYEEGPDA